MRRLFIATIVAAVATVAFATWSIAAPSRSGRDAAPAGTQASSKLPALPSEIRSRGRWQIGVKCDTPPFGHIKNNQNGGYDVEVARRFAQLAFGSRSRVEFTCVTTQSRIPTLTAKRVDLAIATITWTAEREKTIDFSIPYFGNAGSLLVKNSVRLGKLTTGLRGKTVVTTPGSVYDSWVKNCFKDTKLLVITGPSNGVLAVKDGRADVMMYDNAFNVGVAANESELRLTNHRFLAIPWGIGIRKDEPATKRWVDAAVRAMTAKDEFWKIMRRTVPRRFYGIFRNSVPRPKVKLAYPRGTSPETKCPR